MPAAALQNLGLQAGWTLGEDGWNTGMDANLRRLDALIQARAVDKDLSTPPGSPANGAVYVVAASPTGAWAGQATKIARYHQPTALWEFYTPLSGWEIFMVDESVKYRFNGTAWVALP